MLPEPLLRPDAMPSLRMRPDYAIRLAGGGTVETRGGRLLNVLPRASRPHPYPDF